MTARPSSWQPSALHRAAFFSLLALEGLTALVSLAAIPPDPKNSLVFGYSLNRLALMAAALAVVVVVVWLAVLSLRRSPVVDRLLHPARFFRPYLSAVLALSAAAWLTMVFLRLDPQGPFASYAERLRPLLVLGWLLGWQAGAWLALERFSLACPDLNAARSWLRPAAVAAAVLVLLVVLILLTGIGLTPDLYAWSSAGVPFLAWQFGAVALLGILLFVAAPRLENLPGRASFWVDAGIVCLLWGMAAAVWLSQPVTPSYYAPLRPPNNAFYPYSDASYYDLSAQQLLLGNGFGGGKVVTRPLYILFLALSHALAGQEYAGVVTLQTLLLAFFPAAIYLLGRLAHSRAAGLMLALLVTIRELNAFAATPLTEVSHSKLLLTDFPTALGVAVICLLVMVWLRAPHRRWLPLAAGGGLGFLVMLRAQAVMFLPFILLAALLAYPRRLRFWLEASLLFGLGLAVVIAPWLVRNYALTGQVVFDQSSNQSVIFGQRYSLTANDLPARLPGETAEQFSSRMMGTAKQFVLQHPLYTARFILAHLLNNEIATLSVLPFYLSLDDYRDTLLLSSVFWPDTFSSLNWQEFLLLVAYLGLLAAGLGVLWHRLGVASLVPLILNLAYSLSNAVARNSGWRYILPVDWVGMFYVCIGLLALSGWLFGRSQPSRSVAALASGSFPRRAVLVLTGLLLALASVVPLAERAFPVRFSPQARADLEFALVQKVPGLQPPDDRSLILRGLALYPRFYHSGQGETGTGWPVFHPQEGERLAFFVVGSHGIQQVLLPLEKEPESFPNAAEVLIMGCKSPDEAYIRAGLVVLAGEPDQVLVSAHRPAGNCP